MSQHATLPLLIDAANRALGDGDASRAALVASLAEAVPSAVAERVLRALRSFPKAARAEIAHALLDGTPGLWHLLVRECPDASLLVELFARGDADPIAAAALVRGLLRGDVEPPHAYSKARKICRRWRAHDGFCLSLASSLEEEDLAGGNELLLLLRPEAPQAEHAVLDALTDWGVAEHRARLLSALSGPAPETAAYLLAWQAAHGDDYEMSHCLPCAWCPALLRAFVRQVPPIRYLPFLDPLLVLREADAQGALDVLHALADRVSRDHTLELVEALGRHGNGPTLALLDTMDDGWFLAPARKRAVARAMDAIRERHGAGSISVVAQGGGLAEAAEEPHPQDG